MEMTAEQPSVFVKYDANTLNILDISSKIPNVPVDVIADVITFLVKNLKDINGGKSKYIIIDKYRLGIHRDNGNIIAKVHEREQ